MAGMEDSGSMLDEERSWLQQIPLNLRPGGNKCDQLEKLRRRYHLPNDIFVGILASSPAVMRRVQQNAYAAAKEAMADASEQEVLEAVLRGRVYPENPVGLKLTEQEIRREMQSIYTLEDLIDRIIDVERNERRFVRDPFGVGRRLAKKVDKILSS